MSEMIKCAYSLFDEGRKYSGNHRKYLLENAKEICYSPATRERIRLREALGYYGHGRRMLSGRMDIGETELAVMPDGTKAIIDNVPSNTTVAFDVADDGTITHVQEILPTDTGAIVSKLNAGKIGGFSWACPGKDGGRSRPTIMSGFSGFDYVLRPGFSGNRGYLLESADAEDKILECVAAVVHDDKAAEAIVERWKLSSDDSDEALFAAQGQLCELKGQLFESANRLAEEKKQLEAVQKQLADMTSQCMDLKMDQAALRKDVRGILESVCDKLPFIIPDEAMHDMLEGDFTRARAIIEEAAVYDYSHLPIRPVKKETYIRADKHMKEEPEYGTAEYGFSLKL